MLKLIVVTFFTILVNIITLPPPIHRYSPIPKDCIPQMCEKIQGSIELKLAALFEMSSPSRLSMSYIELWSEVVISVE